MNTKPLFILFLFILISSCSKTVNYSPEHIKNTSGRYLYNQEEVIDVYYEDNELFLKWKGAEKIKPVIMNENVFFVADMYAKLHFVQHPETKERYLSKIPKDNENLITYDYLKVSDSFKTPRMYLNDKEYKKAFKAYLEIKKQDSTSVLIDEGELNRLGYQLLRNNENEDAIDVFKMNVALYPGSSNVYDSLAEAYLKSGDSLRAYNNYKIASEMNSDNERAKKYVNAYAESHK
ncbi:tetratricopeptide repeat protein [Yeosuana sp. MJ-SS3]|uniref:Tetratricopeptide repeat protein n=1 Tax=Gilvirhabdus luticola TaxID=3079858 RepID=A0ABU3U4V0_9FLAO|nr:tetratricopeptide repeat protein [Yeosuana sp. MJ-SS3]MDU8885440.1 tetratricopeptide repeat protein [Yeosuana sp. MJ-SS3]